MNYILITNNQKIYHFFRDTDEVIFLKEGSLEGVLSLVQEKIKQGHRLLTDPIISNISEILNPYKSIAITESVFKDASESLTFIKKAILISKQLEEPRVQLTEEKKEELRYIDLSILQESLKNL